jgi:phospholipase/carboxylesterase
VVSVNGQHPSTLGSGREWFSVVGITEQNRPARIAQAMPLFRQAVAHWQHHSGVDVAHTALVGFSQGAILSLESTQTGDTPLAAQVVSLAGRLATPARSAPAGVRWHLIHGTQDGVVSAQHAQQAAPLQFIVNAAAGSSDAEAKREVVEAALRAVAGAVTCCSAAPPS